MEENIPEPTLPDLKEHTDNLQKQMVLLAERANAGKLSESDTALYQALLSSNVLIVNLSHQLERVVQTVSNQADTARIMMESQKLMIDLLQRWHGIDVSGASPTLGEDEHG